MEAGFQDVRLDQVRSVTAEQLLSRLLKSHGSLAWNPRGKVPSPTLVDAERVLLSLVAMAENLKPILDIHPNIRLIPLYGVDSDGVCTCRGRIRCEKPGKHPRILDWTSSEKGTASVFVLADWLYFWGCGINVGVKTGLLGFEGEKPVYLVIVDLDTDDPWRQWSILRELEAQKTVVVKTQSGGLHLYYLSAVEIANTVRFMHCVDTRGKGGQGVIPGSRGAKGTYGFARDSHCYSDEIGFLGKEMETRILSSSFSSPVSSVQERGVAYSFSPSPDLGVTLPRAEGKASVPESAFWCVQRGAAKKMVEWTENDIPFCVPSGCRNRAAYRIACYLRVHRAYEKDGIGRFLDRLRASSMEAPKSFSNAEIETIVKSASKFQAQKTTKRRLSAGEEYEPTPEEDAFMGPLEKSNGYEASLSEIADAYQQMLENLCGWKFKKKIDPNVVADVLRAEGFSVSRRKIDGVQRRYWNVSVNSLPRNIQSIPLPKAYVFRQIRVLQDEYARIKGSSTPVQHHFPSPPTASVAPANDTEAALVPGESPPATEEAYEKVSDLGERVARTTEALREARERLLRPVTRSPQQLERDRLWTNALGETSAEQEERSRLDIERQFAAL
ncbi:MAG: bifunctional primase/polymerase [Myxococcaceae bacterium]|nr:bifunctional primase/polymerase [Myxococcaceae bacterium]